jgi:hypothetical protein
MAINALNNQRPEANQYADLWQRYKNWVGTHADPQIARTVSDAVEFFRGTGARFYELQFNVQTKQFESVANPRIAPSFFYPSGREAGEFFSSTDMSNDQAEATRLAQRLNATINTMLPIWQLENEAAGRDPNLSIYNFFAAHHVDVDKLSGNKILTPEQRQGRMNMGAGSFAQPNLQPENARPTRQFPLSLGQEVPTSRRRNPGD